MTRSKAGQLAPNRATLNQLIESDDPMHSIRTPENLFAMPLHIEVLYEFADAQARVPECVAARDISPLYINTLRDSMRRDSYGVSARVPSLDFFDCSDDDGEC